MQIYKSMCAIATVDVQTQNKRAQAFFLANLLLYICFGYIDKCKMLTSQVPADQNAHR